MVAREIPPLNNSPWCRWGRLKEPKATTSCKKTWDTVLFFWLYWPASGPLLPFISKLLAIQLTMLKMWGNNFKMEGRREVSIISHRGNIKQNINILMWYHWWCVPIILDSIISPHVKLFIKIIISITLRACYRCSSVVDHCSFCWLFLRDNKWKRKCCR